MEKKFPIKVRNNLKKIRYAGSIRFGANETKVISASAYYDNQKEFDIALERTIDEKGNTAFTLITDEEYNKHLKKMEAEKKKRMDTKEVSIMQALKDGLHYKKAQKRIEKEVTTLQQAKDLWAEGISLGYDSTHTVMAQLHNLIQSFNLGTYHNSQICD